MKRFYSSNISQTLAILEGKEKDHCIKVLRTQLNEKVEIVDGKGNLFIGELLNAGKLTADISITNKVKEADEKPLLTIACCIPKNASRWETFLEKSTEIGVKRIIPLIAKRSEKSNVRKERNEQILVSAFKQSGHLFLPELQEPKKFKEVLLDL